MACSTALGITNAVSVARGRSDWLVEVPCPEEVRATTPDLAALAAVAEVRRGVIVTAVGDGLHDVVSRFFAPAAGIPEDPVTGSAHTTLAPFWAERLATNDFLAHQASARGGVIKVSLRDDRVLLGGQAVTVFRGSLENDLLDAMFSRARRRPRPPPPDPQGWMSMTILPTLALDSMRSWAAAIRSSG